MFQGHKYRCRVAAGILAVTLIVLFAETGWAQQSSGIAGLVRDTSGGVLPGVTVEAASPALIEKVRTVVTDTEGRYNIVDLVPGPYVVTFTLPGFNTFRREGVVLTSGFTALVNADMQVGSLQETITVSGQTPIVDVQNVRRQTVIGSDLLAELPSSTKHWGMLVEVTPGFTGQSDVAGSLNQNLGGTYHGKSGSKRQFEGMGIDWSGGNIGYIANSAMVEEVSMQTSGISAETNADGAVVNMIAKSGSNDLKFALSGLYTNDSLETSNLNADLEGRGLKTVSRILAVYDYGLTAGGPIKRDKLWFFGSFRNWGNKHQMAGNYFNATQGSMFYTPDLRRPAYRNQWYESRAVRLTWQISERNKFTAFADHGDQCICRALGAIGDAPEAGSNFRFKPVGLYQATWSSPRTNRLLLDAGASFAVFNFPNFTPSMVTPGVISILEQSTNMRYNDRALYTKPTNYAPRYVQRFSVSYVTGTHAYKVGVQNEAGSQKTTNSVLYPGNVSYTFNNQVPVQLTQYATPYTIFSRYRWDLGLFVQDQWSLKKLTLNYGVRYEYFNGSVPRQHVDAQPNGWIPARDFDAVSNAPSWKDLSPRLGAAYDVFGNGKTALKVSAGRYVAKTGIGFVNTANPIQTSVNQTTRSWTDGNGNYVPDCDLGNFALNGECGAIANINFGKNNPAATQFAGNVMHGWGVRPYNWDVSAEVQQQLSPSVSVSAGYFRNWYDNFTATRNLATTPSDYSDFCITAPVDSRLPSGGNYSVCGLSDVSLAKFGLANNLVMQVGDIGGTQAKTNDFLSVGLSTHFASAIRLGAGFDTGRTVSDTCFVNNAKQDLLFCRVVTPFKAQTQFKMFGSYALPLDFLVSGVYQNVSGISYGANYAVPNALIVPSLGRSLAACGTRPTCTASATVPLVAPQTQFEPRWTRIDLRLSKTLRIGPRYRVQGNVDLYNVMNRAGIIQENQTYGAQWRLPTELEDPRILQFSAQFDF